MQNLFLMFQQSWCLEILHSVVTCDYGVVVGQPPVSVFLPKLFLKTTKLP
jgi:hypothetical protein